MAVLIRLAAAEDAAAIAAIYRPYVEQSRISFEEAAPDAAEMARRMTQQAGLYPWFVAVEDGQVLGYSASAPFRTRPAYRWTVEISVYLAAEACGRGIGSALLAPLLSLLERQGYVAAIGAIALPNPASIRMHEKHGFIHTGTYRQVGFKMAEWLDVGLWEKDLAPRHAAPAEPLPYAELFAEPIRCGSVFPAPPSPPP
jgi:L-amino acid N-acyltransferase YncA